MRHHIYLFWATIVAVTLVSGLLLYAHKYHGFDLNIWLATLGTVVTAVAFAFGTYFVLLAIDAYSQVAVIRQSTVAIQQAMEEVRLTGEALKQARQDAQNTAKEVEEEAFAAVEAVMVAMAEYVQRMPASGTAQRKAAKNLLEQTQCIRARFICKHSRDGEAVETACLLLINFRDQTAIKILENAKDRFKDNKELCARLDYSIKMLRMHPQES